MLDRVKTLLDYPKIVGDIQRMRNLARGKNTGFAFEFSQRNFSANLATPRYTDLTTNGVSDGVSEASLPMSNNRKFFAGSINYIDIVVTGFAVAGVVGIEVNLYSEATFGTKRVHYHQEYIDGDGTVRVQLKQYDFVIATHLYLAKESGTFTVSTQQNVTGLIFSPQNS